ncbi:hypothetical protein LBMAG53_37690 [Planctomycetota bacterium]|nr:hypothetical protein LBMAG53_37690 [Planctomycetota bacterium]
MPDAPALDATTYEVVRRRLEGQVAALAASAKTLGDRRQELFGGRSLTLTATHRVRTEHNSIPRDLIAVGGRFLLGFQVVLGLQSRISAGEVFLELAEQAGAGQDALIALGKDQRTFTADPGFVKDFSEIFQYFKEARLYHLRTTPTRVLAAFQIGSRASDLRVLRWAIERSGGRESVRYLDNRGLEDYQFPASHDFAWTRATRDQHVQGAHPHINIADTVFVECIHGDLTVKVENNTATGQGVYSEPVDDPTQGLDDAEIHFALLECGIVLKIRPYREKQFRYLVFNRQTRSAVRIDAIGQACQQLPEGHGLVYPGGYYLSDGTWKTFPVDAAGMEFKRTIRAPSGEDVAYVFYRRDLGTYLLLIYNLISRTMAPPVHCHSYCRLSDGRVFVLRAEAEASRVHTIQVWDSPFCDEDVAAAAPPRDSPLARIGNRDLVRALSDLSLIQHLVANPSPNRQIYEDLLKGIARTLDRYGWLGEPEAGGVKDRLGELRKTAEQAIDEFAKVEELTAEAAERVRQQQASAASLLREISLATKDTIAAFTTPLAGLRAQRGQIDQLKSTRFIAVDQLDGLDAKLAKAAAELSEQAVAFLLRPESLAPLASEVAALEQQGAAIDSVIAAKPVAERLAAIASAGELLVQTVDGLAIEDANQRTEILGRIAEVLAAGNRAKAVTERRRKELSGVENRAAWAVQSQLLAQAVTAAVGLCSTPDSCDEQTARLLAQVESLEGRFADSDAVLAELVEQRERITEILGSRRQQLADERAKACDRLVDACQRLLTTIAKRAKECASLDALSAYLASDPLAAKFRHQTTALRQLGGAVMADDLDGKLQAAREAASRAIRDRADLVDGDGLVRIGRHRFTVNRQAAELALLVRDDGAQRRLVFQLAGSDLEWPCADNDAVSFASVWDQILESEDQSTCRAEYLAWLLLDQTAEPGADLEALVRSVAADRPELGIERGIHDHDAVKILVSLRHLSATAGLLRYSAADRAAAILAWSRCTDSELKQRLIAEATSLARLRGIGGSPDDSALVAACAELGAPHPSSTNLAAPSASSAERQSASGAIFVNENPNKNQSPTQAKPSWRSALPGQAPNQAQPSWRSALPAGSALPALAALAAGAYLAAELARSGGASFVVSGEAVTLRTKFDDWLRNHQADLQFADDLATVSSDLDGQLRLATAWVSAACTPELSNAIPEVAAWLLTPGIDREPITARTAMAIEGLLANHPRIRDGRMDLRLDEAATRLTRFARDTVPLFRAWRTRRAAILAAERTRLRLDELTPKVLTSFVRNTLVDQVYLPMVGDNLAKQIGSAGAGRRTDSQGLLLLISPPGYGKTTLLEYVAAVLGLAWIKVNGPALGHRTRSLDPAEAPNATARQEVERINLALAMGSNVLLLLDDIQHCDPEFLQKFIPLCDGTRRIEGVWRGQAKTFDLRGKRFVVAMAGNPYTESGDRFSIPDMLANRADTWNLGDVAGGNAAAFASSFLENCLVASPVLQPLAARPPQDLVRLLRIAGGDDSARTELEHPYSGAELGDVVAVLRHLSTARDLLLKVNAAYIASAAQQDGDRTEPAFKLQGSYRNMAKIAARVVPALSAAELTGVLLDHYQAESQTLTTAAESNVLKMKELLGVLDSIEGERWATIKRGFVRRTDLAGSDDPQEKAVVMLAKLGERIELLQGALVKALAESGAVFRQTAEHQTASAAQRQAADDRLASTAAEHQTALTEVIAKLGAALTALRSEPPRIEVASPKIEVINTLPATYAKLYEKQIWVIEAALVPVLELLSKHVGGTIQTRKQMEAIAADLRSMMRKANEAQVIKPGQHDAPDEPPTTWAGPER